MSNAYLAAQKTRYRVTLDIEVLEDFDPHQIEWEKVLDLQGGESTKTYIENLSAPDSW
jgi:hypothetical protein